MHTHRTIHSRPLYVLGIAACASVGACAQDRDTNAAAQPQRLCTATTLEPDLEAAPLAGPGVNPDTGKLELPNGMHYVVSSTYGVPRPGPDGAGISPRYLTLFDAVSKQLEKERGLLAIALASSDSCGSGRTLAVWRSEETMYDFVTSDAHLAAMTAAPEILQPGYAVTHWDATSLDQITFDEATHRFHEDK